VLLVRAIVRSADVPLSATPDLVVVRAERVAALASRSDRTPIPTDTELREHDTIARRIHESAPSLPSRFGQHFADEPALARALQDREHALAESLDAVGERVELAVTLRWRTDRITGKARDASTGRAYLEGRAAREHERQAAEQLVARLVEQLPCERAFIRHSVCPRVGVAAVVAILAARDEVKNLQRSAESFGERSAEVSAVVHGPLPPYTFAE
jgi:hypothetical protein